MLETVKTACTLPDGSVKSRFEDLNKRGVLFLVAYYNDIEGKN
ncbi:hypothetical protein ENHY17A_170078 [Moraxellaceae bacterium 17A]|nr:hypothetical protein ENHY17A_170078 [Moraxellaceae bacterium 17A]